MTDLNITPTLELNETISNPEEPAEVIGFHGRDTKIGLDAVVMKEEAVEGELVEVTEDGAEKIVDGPAELVVLNDGIVSVMGSDTFKRESDKHGRVALGSAGFNDFDRDNVEVGN
jgi:hypothetical protein